MRTVFISSVIEGYEEMRQAARRGVELMGLKPITVETDFAAQVYSPEQACLTAVSQADVYIVLAGQRFGYATDAGASVTQAEYHEARRTQRPTLVFIENVDAPEPDQKAFIDELQDYAKGQFRRTFSSPEELKDEIVRALRQLDESQNAATEAAFEERLAKAISDDRQGRWSFDSSQPKLTAAWWPQPIHDRELNELERNLDRYFDTACAQGLVRKRDGYESVSGPDYVGFVSQAHRIRLFEDGPLVYQGTPTTPAEFRDNHFAGLFVSPSQVHYSVLAASHLFAAAGAWCHISLSDMAHRNFAEPPPRDQHSIGMPMLGSQDVARNRCLIPYTAEHYQQFVERAVDQFRRELKHQH